MTENPENFDKKYVNAIGHFSFPEDLESFIERPKIAWYNRKIIKTIDRCSSKRLLVYDEF